MSTATVQMEAIDRALDNAQNGISNGDWLNANFALIVHRSIPYICISGKKKSAAKGGISLEIGAPNWHGIRNKHGMAVSFISSVASAKASIKHNPGMEIVQEGELLSNTCPNIIYKNGTFRITTGSQEIK